MNRRHFIKLAGIAPAVLLAPQALLAGEVAAPRVLVLVELKGGNDGLNTVIPFADANYYRLRPQLAVAKDQVLRIDERVGLHPSLAKTRALFDEDQVAIVQGVGYDSPNRSHFRSIEIWETASRSDEFLTEGWLARAMERRRGDELVLDGVTIGEQDAGPMRGDPRAMTVRDPEQLMRAARRLLRATEAESQNPALAHVLTTQRELMRATEGINEHLTRAPELGVDFPKHRLGKQLEIAAQLIASGLPLMVVRVTHGSFDTHANQPNQHANLLKQLDEGLAALRQALVEHDRWRDALVMTYSEFGRRAAQNGSRGTDHGTAAPHLIMGGGVKGGLYGKHPSLTDLASGDLKHHVDFRQLYRTAGRWLGLELPSLGAHRPLDLLT